MSAKSSYYIDAPVETVFEAFRDPAFASEGTMWDAREVKTTQEGTGTFSIWGLTIRGIRMPFQMVNVYTEFEPNERIVEKSSSAMVGTWEYTFEPEGKGTRLTMEHHSRGLWSAPPIRTLGDLLVPRLTEKVFLPRLRKSVAALPQQRTATTSTKRKVKAAR